MSNETETVHADITGDRAIEVLSMMQDQLAQVIGHFSSQDIDITVSTDTRNKTLAQMNDQLQALRLGVTALKALKATAHAMPDDVMDPTTPPAALQ